MKTNNSTVELEDSYLEQHFNRIKSYNKPKSYWLKPIKGWRDNLDLYITNKLDNDISIVAESDKQFNGELHPNTKYVVENYSTIKEEYYQRCKELINSKI